MKNTLFLWLFVGLLFISMSIPLILEKVPPNKWYGFRVAKTFSSEGIWYSANRVAGYDLLSVGILTVVTAVVTRLIFNQMGSTNVQIINFAVFISALVVAVIHSFLNLNRL
ncbi:MAG: hypothetical protein RLZZ04_3190 [Cyanobacteriota bacterium]|jgi:uncharacterized membrane protein